MLRLDPNVFGEIALSDNFLCEATFIPESVEASPREIINAPELQVYVQNFGMQEGDICFVAEVEEKIVGIRCLVDSVKRNRKKS